jgi:hypothetical protein
MSFTVGFDVTAAFFSQVPQGFQLAGYDTGAGVAWTPQMWAAHPGAIHIDQEPQAQDTTADVLDCESGAVPVGSPKIPAWAKGALSSFNKAARPGQRAPLLYCSASNVTANVNALLAGGVSSGVGLWVANWSLSQASAVAALAAAAGPFPVQGIQFNDDGDWDADVWSTAWLDNVSGGGWVFGPVRQADFWPGLTTFGITFYSPGTPEALGVGNYEVAVFEGPKEAFGQGAQVPGYPVHVPKAASSLQSYEGHGVPVKTEVTVGIRAIATDGAHAGPWVTGTITTGS